MVARGMLLVKAFLKIFGICSKLMKFALKRRKFAFLNRNKDADWREGENKKEVAAWAASSPSQSIPVGFASSPKGRAFGSPRKLHLFAKASPFEERLPPRRDAALSAA